MRCRGRRSRERVCGLVGASLSLASRFRHAVLKAVHALGQGGAGGVSFLLPFLTPLEMPHP